MWVSIMNLSPTWDNEPKHVMALSRNVHSVKFSVLGNE